MPAVPPTTTTHPSLDMSFLLVALPGVDPAVGVPGGRLRGLCLDPSHAAVAGVEEAVRRADPGEHDVARAQRDFLTVEDALDLTIEEEVRLLERMVVDLGRATRLVVDREHRQQFGPEDPIDQHL